MTILQILLISFIISLTITSIGFKKTVWFISIGYTFTIAGFSIISLIYYHPTFSIFNYLQVFLLLIWGFRLGFFIIRRESDKQYNSSVNDQTSASQELPFPVKTAIWVSVSLLYVCMYSPSIFTTQKALYSSVFTNAGQSLGLLFLFSGIVIESMADKQKSQFKKQNPKNYCNTGLYKWVRCPNYLGEIMVWLGNFICGISFYNSWWQWSIATTGLLAIVLIMMGSAKRLEKKQFQNYGKDPAFQKYEKTVPILFPWIPLYSLQNIKVYLE